MNAPMRTGCGRAAATLTITFALAWAAPATAGAQEEAETDPREAVRARRSVGEHSYSQLDIVEWPFVATRVSTRTRLGVDQFELDGLPPDPDRTFEGDFTTIGQGVGLGIRFLDWLGMEIELAGGGILGSDSLGALFVGVNGFAGGRLSGVVRLIETDTVLLSARLNLAGYSVLGVAPARVVNAFTQDSPVPLSEIRTTFDGNVGHLGGSLAGIVTANRWLGFMGSFLVNGRRIEISDNDEIEGNLAGALGVSFNFGQLGVPLQILAGTRVNWNFGDGFIDVAVAAVDAVGDVQVQPELALYYADPRHPELELGLTGTFIVSQLSERGRFGFDLAYWW